MHRTSHFLLTVQFALLAACARSPSSSDGTPATPMPASHTSPDALAPEPATGASACAFWGSRGFSLRYSHQSSHGASFRRFAYDDATGALTVHDSSVASPASTARPKVVERAISLAPEQRDALAAELVQQCPDASDLTGECGEGGCTQLEVTRREGAPSTVQSWDGSEAIGQRLSSFFPELRPPAGSATPPVQPR